MPEVAKCPLCGSELFGSVDGIVECKTWCSFRCGGYALHRIAAAMEFYEADNRLGGNVTFEDYVTLLTRHNALREAVAWLREVDDTREWLMEFPWLRKWSGLDQCISEARAEVDRLIGEGEE